MEKQKEKIFRIFRTCILFRTFPFMYRFYCGRVLSTLFIFSFLGGMFMKEKIMVFGFFILLSCFSIGSFLDEKMEFSKAERRKLIDFPRLEMEKIWNGSFFSSLDTYVAEQFPHREEFRRKKAWFFKNIYQKRENHGAIKIKDTIYQLETKVNDKSIDYFTNKLNTLKQEYFPHKEVYYAIIPDKNYYVEEALFPKMNYSYLKEQIREKLAPSFLTIDLWESLHLNAYYQTDIHWKQEELYPVLEVLQQKLKLPPFSSLKEKKSYYPFYGSYASKVYNPKPDTLTYFTSEVIEKATVYNYEKKQWIPVYPEENVKHMDAYDVFLDGATPLLILENKQANTKRELLLFRDSFSSSLAPLLLENYHKITLIDLRYIKGSILKEISEIDWNCKEQDVLFLYGVPLINQSFTLK